MTGRETRKDGRKRLYILGPHGTVAVGMRPAGVKGSALSWPGADQRSLLAPERVLGVGTPVAATIPTSVSSLLQEVRAVVPGEASGSF